MLEKSDQRIMSGTVGSEGKIEARIRPYSGNNNQERLDQKGVSRVYLCKEVLTALKLDPGQVCYLSKIDEIGSPIQKREAIIWPTHEKNLSKRVVQVSKTFQEACGFKLGDNVLIEPAGTIHESENVVLKDVTTLISEDTPELEEHDKSHWEWYIRENLVSRLVKIMDHSYIHNTSCKRSKLYLDTE